MGRERRRDALKTKLQRLEECIAKTRKDKDGIFQVFLSLASLVN